MNELKQFFFKCDRYEGNICINDTSEESARRWAKFYGIKLGELVNVKGIYDRDGMEGRYLHE